MPITSNKIKTKGKTIRDLWGLAWLILRWDSFSRHKTSKRERITRERRWPPMRIQKAKEEEEVIYYQPKGGEYRTEYY